MRRSPRRPCRAPTRARRRGPPRRDRRTCGTARAVGPAHRARFHRQRLPVERPTSDEDDDAVRLEASFEPRVSHESAEVRAQVLGERCYGVADQRKHAPLFPAHARSIRGASPATLKHSDRGDPLTQTTRSRDVLSSPAAGRFLNELPSSNARMPGWGFPHRIAISFGQLDGGFHSVSRPRSARSGRRRLLLRRHGSGASSTRPKAVRRDRCGNSWSRIATTLGSTGIVSRPNVVASSASMTNPCSG